MRRANTRGGVGELIDVIDAGDKVVVIMRPKGAGSDARVANLTTFRDGQVVEMVHYPTVGDALSAANLAG